MDWIHLDQNSYQWRYLVNEGGRAREILSAKTIVAATYGAGDF